MKKAGIVAIIVLSFLTTTKATINASSYEQKSGPGEVVINFYRALKAKKYVEGFHYSIYRWAIEGLTAAELQDLEPDFARTFSEIPEKIEAKGEQINGTTAIVFLKFDGEEKLQQVSLIRQGDEWLVGDPESFALVRKQGRAYFFNTRMDVNEDETHETIQRILSAELLYASRFEGKNATLADLVRLQALPQDMEDAEASGYRFVLTISADQKSFFLTATPSAYNKTGRLSFYADLKGVHAADLKGQIATMSAPLYQPK